MQLSNEEVIDQYYKSVYAFASSLEGETQVDDAHTVQVTKPDFAEANTAYIFLKRHSKAVSMIQLDMPPILQKRLEEFAKLALMEACQWQDLSAINTFNGHLEDAIVRRLYYEANPEDIGHAG